MGNRTVGVTLTCVDELTKQIVLWHLRQMRNDGEFVWSNKPEPSQVNFMWLCTPREAERVLGAENTRHYVITRQDHAQVIAKDFYRFIMEVCHAAK